MERWRVKKYSYSLSCTHVTSKIPTILPIPSSNLEIRMTTTIAGVGKNFTAENKHTYYDMPNHHVHTGHEEGKMQRDCGAI
jgi:hypothetical protein